MSSDPFSALRVPTIRKFAFGRLLATIGAQVVTVTAGWQLYERTGDAWSLGLIGLVEIAPVFALSIPAGQIADRLPKRYIAAAMYVVMAVCAVALTAASYWNLANGWIYFLLFLMSAAGAISTPSVGSIIPELIPAELFLNANTWLASSFQIGCVVGPPLGGAVIALTHHSGFAYLVTAITFSAFALVLSSMPAPDRSIAPEKQNWSDLWVGLRFVRRQPIFLSAITLDLFAVLLGGATALLPIFARDILKIGPAGLGYLRAAPSIGAILVALTMTRLPPFKRPGRALTIAVIGFGLATIGFGLSTSFWFSLFCLFMTGVFDNVSVVVRRTLEQILTPNSMRGRVAAVHYVFIGMSNELGGFESGLMAKLLGTQLSVVVGGIGTLLVVGFVRLVWPQLYQLPPFAELSNPNLPSPPAPREA